MRKNFYFILILMFSLSACTFAQYKISIEASQFENDTLIFGHYFNESIMIQDTFFINSSGFGTIEGSKNLPEGMYTIYFPNTSRLDILIDKDQLFSLKVDTIDLAGKTVFKGSKENSLFYEYLNYLNAKRMEAEPYHKLIAEAGSPVDSISAKQSIDKITADVKSYITKLIEDNQDLFLSKFLLALKEIDVPDFPRDDEGNITDSSFQVRYYKQHYFDYFDLSDVRLLRSPLYENKLKTYLERWTYPNPDSIYREVDMLIEKSRTDTLLFKYMLTTLFNHYAKSKYIGMDAIYAYIGDKYYVPEATWADSSFINDLKERIKKITPLIIGSKGPDIRMVSLSDEHFIKAADDTLLKKDPYQGGFFNLYDIEADFTILYFWEADCGHCKKTIPLLNELYNEMKEYNVKVVAVNMLGGVEGKVKWIDFINEHSLYGWINAWNPYDYSYRDAYDVTSSNIMYLLDKDKTIIAKRIGPEQALEIIKFEAKKKKENE